MGLMHEFEDDSIAILTDSYKQTHYPQYEKGTTRISSYLESRGGRHDETVFFGLQYYINRYLLYPITMAEVDFAEMVVDNHMGPGLFNRKGWEHIVQKHHGELPIKIWAVPEGSVNPVHTPLVVVENTDDEVPWLTNHLESLLVNVWYPCTVATQSYYMKKMIREYLVKTADESALPGLEYKMHDFAVRGVTCPEQAAIGGCAHLTSFSGTDNLPGIVMSGAYYDSLYKIGKSIPASEHSTITSWGRHRETDAMRNMLRQYPTGMMACVSDSFDIFNACANIWGGVLKEEVLARDGILVIRPDSGPHTNLIRLLEILGEKFGYTANTKGYKLLHPKVRLIQGDGVNYKSMVEIMQMLMSNGWSVDNLAFGSGGGLLQDMNRDTGKYAFKCSAAEINGEWRDVYKDPVTDPGKTSFRGRINTDHMKLVYNQGVSCNNQKLVDIRARIEAHATSERKKHEEAVCNI